MSTYQTIIIVIVHNKGGIGKTTIASGIANSLAANGKDVLVVELEASPRMYLIHLGTGVKLRQSETVYNMLTNPEQGLPGAFAIDVPTYLTKIPSLSKEQRQKIFEERQWLSPKPWHLIPGNRDIADLNDRLRGIADKGEDPTKIFAQALKPALGRYEYIIIDTPPTSNLQQAMAIKAAAHLGQTGHIIAPVDFDYPVSAEDFALTLDTITNAQQDCEIARLTPPKFAGVVFNRFTGDINDNANDDTLVLHQYRNGEIKAVEMGLLPSDEKTCKRAISQHQSPVTFAPTSGIGKALYTMTQTIVKTIGGA